MLCACGTRLAYMPLNKAPRAMKARSPGDMEVFTTSMPSRSFTEVGMIEAQQESIYSTESTQQVFARMREEAAARGCDALIVQGSNDSVQGYGGHDSSTTRTLKGYRGTCIVYNEDDGARAPAEAEAEAPKTTDARTP